MRWASCAPPGHRHADGHAGVRAFFGQHLGHYGTHHLARHGVDGRLAHPDGQARQRDRAHALAGQEDDLAGII